MLAQKLSVQSVDIEANSDVEIVLVNEVVDNAVALQLTLGLPNELVVDESSINRGSGIEEHQMEWRRTNDNSYLFVFYNMDNSVLSSGELIRVPVIVKATEGTYTCEVRSIRASDVENKGNDGESLTFNVNVTTPVGISKLNTNGLKEDETLYDLQGRAIQSSQASKRTIYILNGKKIVLK